jgi:curved DNA-binding protein CbpA
MKVGYFEAQHDFYAILGVPPAATAAQIRTAHRRLVWELHPDRSRERQGGERRIALVNLAATVLLNPAARARYDELRQQAKSGRLPYPHSAPSPSGARPHAASYRARRWRPVDERPGPLVADDFIKRLFAGAVTATLLIACISERTKPTEAEKRLRYQQHMNDPILYAPDYPPYPVRYATVEPSQD